MIGLKAVRESLFNNSSPVSVIHLLAFVIDELPLIQLQRLPRLQLLNKLSLMDLVHTGDKRMITFGHAFGIHNQIGANLGELVAIYLLNYSLFS